LLLVRAAASFGLPKVSGVAVAIVLSAVVFSLFHHLGAGAPPFSRPQFVFRVFAGVVLGVLFAVRGFGVCVYAHAMYDVHYYLTAS
jgi:membrane protease YdiL (CAAX protease family)